MRKCYTFRIVLLMNDRPGTLRELIDSNLILFTGNYGSGKTEVSVNVVSSIATSGEKVVIADLDLVNPYFRCREARQPLEDLGVKVVAPSGDYHDADLPILLPEVRGAIANSELVTVLDVGGDNVGATVLSSLPDVFRNRDYTMYFVLNQNRPFTDTVDGALRFMDEIEAASRLKVGAIAGNTHLMEETDLEMVKNGADFCSEVAEKRGVPLVFVTAPVDQLKAVGYASEDELENQHPVYRDDFPAPILPLKRIMLPPWLGGPPPGTIATHSRDGFARIKSN